MNYKLQKLGSESEEVKKIKPNSVKELLLLAIVNDIPENYYNLSILWERLDLNSLKKFIATDLKLANVVLGIQSHGSTYPSHMCECRRPGRKSGKGYKIGSLRTLGSCRINAQAFEDSMSKKSDSPKYKNCLKQPLFDEPDNVPTMMLIPPSELHLFTGPTNHIYKVIIENEIGILSNKGSSLVCIADSTVLLRYCDYHHVTKLPKIGCCDYSQMSF